MKHRLLHALALCLAWCSLGLMLSASGCTLAAPNLETETICSWDATNRLIFAQTAVKNIPGATLEDAQQYLDDRCKEEWQRYPNHDGTRNPSCGGGGCDDHIVPL